MNHKQSDLLSIGSFAAATQLSLKALRLYDQCGILKPTTIDPFSGYRYYHVSQFQAARLIRMLRQMDMPLATIRKVLEAPPAEAKQLVLEHWQNLQAQVEQARRAVQDVLATMKGEIAFMSFEVQVKTLKVQPIISLTRHVKVDHLGKCIGDSLATLYEIAAQKDAVIDGPPFGIYHGVIDHESDGPIEICVPTRVKMDRVEGAEARELAGGRVAYVSLSGAECEYPAILKGYDAIVDWMQHNGYERTDSPREIWYTEPGEYPRMDIEWAFREKQP
jgi:DNA-binding transcriptional MerR regulator